MELFGPVSALTMHQLLYIWNMKHSQNKFGNLVLELLFLITELPAEEQDTIPPGKTEFF